MKEWRHKNAVVGLNAKLTLSRFIFEFGLHNLAGEGRRGAFNKNVGFIIYRTGFVAIFMAIADASMNCFMAMRIYCNCHLRLCSL